MEQLGAQALTMQGVIDHHEIDQVVPADRIANDLAVADDDRAAAKVVLYIAVRRPTFEEAINCSIAEKRPIVRADRPTGEVNQHAHVGGQRFADQRLHRPDDLAFSGVA
jgi:hypothetical protein